MRTTTKLAVAAAVALAGAAVWGGLALRDAAGAIELGRQSQARAGRIELERRALQLSAAGFEPIAARQDLRDVAWFDGGLWLAGKLPANRPSNSSP